MKKFLCILCALVFACLPMSIVATAEDPHAGNSYTFGDITITLEDGLSEDVKARIIAHLLGQENQGPEGDETDNVLCTLFGHKLTVTYSTVTTHKARATAPRCLQKIYEVSTCSRCDYVSSQLQGSTYIFCCS